MVPRRPKPTTPAVFSKSSRPRKQVSVPHAGLHGRGRFGKAPQYSEHEGERQLGRRAHTLQELGFAAKADDANPGLLACRDVNVVQPGHRTGDDPAPRPFEVLPSDSIAETEPEHVAVCQRLRNGPFARRGDDVSNCLQARQSGFAEVLGFSDSDPRSHWRLLEERKGLLNVRCDLGQLRSEVLGHAPRAVERAGAIPAVFQLGPNRLTDDAGFRLDLSDVAVVLAPVLTVAYQHDRGAEEARVADEAARVAHSDRGRLASTRR